MKEVIMQVADVPSGYPKYPMYVADLVRCRECRWFDEYESMIGTEYYCNKTWCSPYDWASKPCFYVNPDDFCSSGERKDNE